MNKLLSVLIAMVASMPVAQAQDAAQGEKKAAMCIGCHGIPGYQASFPEVHKVPMIAGQNAKYIAAALTAYRKGERKHPTMRAIATTLTDKDIADLSAHYEQQGRPAGTALTTVATTAPATPAAASGTAPAAAAEVLKAGNCVSCHGANFNQPIDPSYPKLAGQHADYLYVSLKAYQTEGNPHVGRANAIMSGMVKPFNHAQLKAVAAYIASQPGELKTVEQSHFR
ncbi:MAG: c-type cytochrome [Burkholderiaceae bacterium]